MGEVGNASKMPEPGEQLKHPTSPVAENRAEQPPFEEANAPRRQRLRYGEFALAGVLALGAGLGSAAYAGASTRSSSGAIAPSRASKLPVSSRADSSTGPGRAPKLRFTTQQAGLAGQTTARERSLGCSWVVPPVPMSAYLDSRIASTQADSMWMGTTDRQLRSFIQVGVDVATTGRTAHYQAYWRLTERIHPVAHPVVPGDELRASIYESSPGTDWVVTIADATQQWRFSQTLISATTCEKRLLFGSRELRLSTKGYTSRRSFP